MNNSTEVLQHYWNSINSMIEYIVSKQYTEMLRAANAIALSIENNRYVYVFGSGHSSIMCKEMFHRAGGLVPVIPLCDLNTLGLDSIKKTISIQNMAGYGKLLLDTYDVEKGSTVIIVSNTGIATLPIEVAIEAKKRGATTIALTSIRASKSLEPRNPYSKRLFEISDIVIDNGVPLEDAVVEIKEFGIKAAPISTILNTFILNSLVLLTIKILISKGIEPPVWRSINTPGGIEFNKKMFEKYPKLLKFL